MIKRICYWCQAETTGENIHQCSEMPRTMRRHTDRPRRRSDGSIVLMGYVFIVIGVIGLTMHAIDDAKTDKRITMMEHTINQLTHEVGDCRINKAGSQPLD